MIAKVLYIVCDFEVNSLIPSCSEINRHPGLVYENDAGWYSVIYLFIYFTYLFLLNYLFIHL